MQLSFIAMNSERRRSMTVKIVELIKNNKIIELSEHLQYMNPVDIAKVLMDLEAKDLY